MVMQVRDHFPTLVKSPQAYLDSAATTLKPQAVIDAMSNYYAYDNGSPNRGAHRLSVSATQVYQESKEVVRNFVGANQNHQIIYTRNATESINLVAESLPSSVFKPGDSLVITITSHHSNILPWQRLAARYQLELVYLYVDSEGQVLADELKKITAKTKVVSVPLISNGNGVVHPVKAIVDVAKTVNAFTLIDACQAAGHMALDFEGSGADFMVFSGHKVYGPMGIGVLVAKKESLDRLNPYTLGGDMIEYVTEQEATFATGAQKFESGTQNVGGAVGLMAAIQWLNEQGLNKVIAHERQMTQDLYKALKARPDIQVYGPSDAVARGALVTFNVKGVHPHDVASILDHHGVAIRAGHHCCQPLMAYSKTHATCRASVGIYTSQEDIAALLKGLDQVREVFKYA